MRINSCPWVLRRLPLLDGGELAMEERRRVERHLIGCPDCRDRRSASVDALSALRAFAGEAPARPGAPSLWPALARQIRESRHAPPRPAWSRSWSWLVSQAAPAMSFGLALGGVLAVGFALGRTAPAPAPTLAGTPPSASGGAASPAPRAPHADRAAARPRGALPDTPARPSKLLTQAVDPFRPPNTRVDYDLDHGYPMGSGPRDPQRSY